MYGVYEIAFAPGTLAELLIAALSLSLTFAVAWRVSKGGGGAAVSELSEANRVLEGRLHELRRDYEQKIEKLGEEIAALRVKNGELAARTDYKAVIDEHERRAQQRAERLLAVLDLIASRLGADPPETTTT